MMAKVVNSDLKKGFTVSQVTEKRGWPEPIVWSIKLEEKDDIGKCHELQWVQGIKSPNSSCCLKVSVV